MVAYILAAVIVLGAAFIAYTLRKKPQAVTPVVTPAVTTPPAPTGVDPTVTTVQLGTAVEALLGGKPTGNGPVSTGIAPDPYRHDTNLDVVGVGFRFEGNTVYTLDAKAGQTYTLEIVPSNDGYAVGFVTPIGFPRVPITNGSANVYFTAQQDGIQAIAVAADKPGLLMRRS